VNDANPPPDHADSGSRSLETIDLPSLHALRFDAPGVVSFSSRVDGQPGGPHRIGLRSDSRTRKDSIMKTKTKVKAGDINVVVAY
jgi:hypothetical protein